MKAIQLNVNRSEKRILRFSFIFMIAGLIIVYVTLSSDVMIGGRLRTLFKQDRNSTVQFNPDTAAKFDIALNSILPNTGAGSEIVKKTSFNGKGYLVVSLGDCASCIRFDTEKWSKDAKTSHVKLLYFSGASKDQIAKFRKAMHITDPIYYDGDNALSRSINCYWNGRVYYYSRNWRLKWQMAGFGSNQSMKQLPELTQLFGVER